MRHVAAQSIARKLLHPAHGVGVKPALQPIDPLLRTGARVVLVRQPRARQVLGPVLTKTHIAVGSQLQGAVLEYEYLRRVHPCVLRHVDVRRQDRPHRRNRARSRLRSENLMHARGYVMAGQARVRTCLVLKPCARRVQRVGVGLKVGKRLGIVARDPLTGGADNTACVGAIVVRVKCNGVLPRPRRREGPPGILHAASPKVATTVVFAIVSDVPRRQDRGDLPGVGHPALDQFAGQEIHRPRSVVAPVRTLAPAFTPPHLDGKCGGAGREVLPLIWRDVVTPAGNGGCLRPGNHVIGRRPR